MLQGLLLAIPGCGDAPARTEPEARVATRAEAPKPVQVVQRIEPAPAVNTAPAAPSTPRTSAVPAATTQQREKRASAGEKITSKHIEAELNRLEAELR